MDMAFRSEKRETVVDVRPKGSPFMLLELIPSEDVPDLFIPK